MRFENHCATAARTRNCKSFFTLFVAGSFLVLSLSGCGASYEASPARYADSSGRMSVAQSPGGNQGAESDALTADNIAGQRKVIYNAELSLQVDDFTSLPDEMFNLVDRFGGYIAEADIKSTEGTSRYGRWKIRIPVEGYKDFLSDISNLGVPTDLKQTSEDVTEEFVDLEAQIASKRKLEQRVLDFLENSQTNLNEVIQLESELERIRSVIERMEGRLNYLSNRAALATITITAREEKEYVPPQSPTFDDQLSTTWASSVGSLQATGQSVALFFVGITPWLPVLLVILLVLWFVWRRFARGRAIPTS